REDPTLTAGKFVTLPAIAKGRLYRTGDTVRRRPDGALEFLGRADNQVKIRGYRVSLEEVEEALMDCPGVAAAAVAAVRDAAGHARLAAFVVVRGGAPENGADGQETLRRRLPAYMVPARFVPLPSLPITPSGKIDRPRLPQPVATAATDRTPPRDVL